MNNKSLSERLGFAEEEILDGGTLRFLNLIITNLNDQIARTQRLTQMRPENRAFTTMLENLHRAKQLATAEVTAIEQKRANRN